MENNKDFTIDNDGYGNTSIGDLVREKLNKLSNDEIREIIGASGICNVLNINVDNISELAPYTKSKLKGIGDLEKFLELPVEEISKINNKNDVNELSDNMQEIEKLEKMSKEQKEKCEKDEASEVRENWKKEKVKERETKVEERTNNKAKNGRE